MNMKQISYKPLPILRNPDKQTLNTINYYYNVTANTAEHITH